MHKRSNAQDHLEIADLKASSDGGTNRENAVNEDIPVEELFTPDKLRTTLYPLIISMKFFGQFYGEPFKQCHKQSNCNFRHEKSHFTGRVEVEPQTYAAGGAKRQHRHCNFGFWFCVFIALYQWFVLAYGVLGMTRLIDFLDGLNRLVIVLWIFACAGQQLVSLLTTSFRRKSSSLTRLDKFVKTIAYVRAGNISKSKKSVRYIVIAGWVSIITLTLTVLIGLNFPDVSVRTDVRNLFFGYIRIIDHGLINYLYSPIHLFVCGNYIFPICLYASLCNIVADRFNDIFERASNDILQTKKMNVASLRREYVKLCHAVSTLDDMLSPFGLFAFAVYIPLACINLNVCIQTFDQSSTIIRVGYIFYNLMNLAILLIVSIAGARVNNSASSLSEILYDININDLDNNKELEELMLLLSNVNSNSTVLTIGGVVTITKEMIITVFGTILAYLTILIQFK